MKESKFFKWNIHLQRNKLFIYNERSYSCELFMQGEDFFIQENKLRIRVI